MSGQDREPTAEAAGTPTADEQEPLTVVAEPVVIDLRDGIDTVAAYEADRDSKAPRG